MLGWKKFTLAEPKLMPKKALKKNPVTKTHFQTRALCQGWHAELFMTWIICSCVSMKHLPEYFHLNLEEAKYTSPGLMDASGIETQHFYFAEKPLS